MSASGTGRERRKVRRLDVTLPARFTTDGKIIHRGLVHSLGPEGMFLETPNLIPIGVTVRIVAPLPDAEGPLRVRAAVLYHHRRNVGGSVPGFGLQFVDPPTELRDRIDRFLDRYTGPVPTDGVGVVRWPVEVPAIDPGWHPISWWSLDPETAEETRGEPAGGEARPALERLLEQLRSVPPDLAEGPEGRIALHYVGKALAPAQGLRSDWLEHSSMRTVLAAQMWALEALEAAQWKLLEVARDQFMAIRGAAQTFQSAREKLAEPPAADGALPGGPLAETDEHTSWNDALHGLDSVARFLDVLELNLSGLVTLEGGAPAAAGAASPAASSVPLGDDFLRGIGGESDGAAATPPQDARGAPAATPDPRTSTGKPATRALRISRRSVAIAAALMVAALGIGATVQAIRNRPSDRYRAYLGVARQALSALASRDAARLADRVEAARSALGAEQAAYASLGALELGLGLLQYLTANAELNDSARSMHTSRWGPGTRYPDRATYRLWQERNESRAQEWIRASEQEATKILNHDRPLSLDMDPTVLATVEAGKQWLNDRQHELELAR